MTATRARPYALTSQEGEALWLMESLSTIKATAESTNGVLTLMEIHGRRGMQVPLHTHEAEEEAWYLVDGTVTFQLEDELLEAERGAFVFVPRGTPHGFRVSSATARFLDIRTPAGFEGFFRAVGDPAPSRELPPVGPGDPGPLVEAAPNFGMHIVGPPPAS